MLHTVFIGLYSSTQTHAHVMVEVNNPAIINNKQNYMLELHDHHLLNIIFRQKLYITAG